MSNRTATEPHAAHEPDHPVEPADAVERVLRTHMAPVTGLEEEVALMLLEADRITGRCDDRRQG